MARVGLPMVEILPTEPLQFPYAAVVTATAGVGVALTALLIVSLHSSPSGRLITTGTGESATAHFADGSDMSAGANAAVQVNITAQQRSADVIAGRFMFTVPDRTTDFLLGTPVAQARIAEAARFQVTVSDLWVDVDVYEGTLMFYEEGSSSEAPTRPVKKGETFHKRRKALAARPVGRGSDSSDGWNTDRRIFPTSPSEAPLHFARSVRLF